ncbi:AraC family transcriptional regulator [Phreatobacter sp. AB_2022a]|uniref:AraC family transcriptional regulator n=1 Tax=Phreatobacter sp. AB_2022a TaxID=3003134 RepID=UPI0022870B3B|nr:AraC family transcriptional regulator [Phreatobacter sp. AB_2022a]MCZ0738369.1 AraC family transcriptional regulator [Phreatobacter sp. AB_2022a]
MRAIDARLVEGSRIDPDLVARCLAIAAAARAGTEPVPTELDGIAVVRNWAPTPIRPTDQRPMICLVLQGAKEIILADRSVRFAAGETAIVSHALVSSSRVMNATATAPYVAVASALDLELLRSLREEIGDAGMAGVRAEAVASGAADRDVVDAMARLLDLIGKPLEQRVLLPLIRRELHFRVLLSRHGAMLRELMRIDSHASRIATAIAHIRRHWDAAIRTEELAGIAGMSLSSFHEHFRAMTSTSPIQYQKSLRLLEARRRLIETGEPVSAVAFAVGYESPTQFSRDYRRAYGASPRSERRAAGLAGTAA